MTRSTAWSVRCVCLAASPPLARLTTGLRVWGASTSCARTGTMFLSRCTAFASSVRSPAAIVAVTVLVVAAGLTLVAGKSLLAGT